MSIGRSPEKNAPDCVGCSFALVRSDNRSIAPLCDCRRDVEEGRKAEQAGSFLGFLAQTVKNLHLSLPETQSGVGRRGPPSGERDGNFGRRDQSARMGRFGACSLGVEIAGGDGSMQMDAAAPQAQQRSRAAIGLATLGTSSLRLRRRVDTRDEDRRCEGKQPPFRVQAIRPGGVRALVEEFQSPS